MEYVESAWDEPSRGWALALAEYRAGLCPHCGGPAKVCQQAEGDRDNPFGTHVWWALPPNVCNIATAVRSGDKVFANPEKALVPRVVKTKRGQKPDGAA